MAAGRGFGKYSRTMLGCMVVTMVAGCGGDSKHAAPSIEYTIVADACPFVTVSANVIGKTESEKMLRDTIEELFQRFPEGYDDHDLLVEGHRWESFTVNLRRKEIRIRVFPINGERVNKLGEKRIAELELFTRMRSQLLSLVSDTIRFRGQHSFEKSTLR